ncbi:hypothetical protein D9619_005208 [Psilocybe cf. subviscida]|uniref:BTB domain-containing protein n=1 Tax=Psilocybe cf. subviscida TaxID=2480587 RepID=A0A8H5FBQ4_9AGAR|nr:hypothetical protein D9619_005208 [Psilocybe cf. subviscida]
MDHSFSDVVMAIEEGSSSRTNFSVEAHSTSAGKAKIEYDPDYFIETSFVVENTLFRVPTYMLINGSQLFGSIFRLPQPMSDDGSIEGLSASNPIVISAKLNIKRDEFRAFVKALYPQSFSANLHLSKIEWIAVLKLSTIWYFLDVRSVAIAELERGGELSYVDKIVLGRTNWISSWVTEGLIGIYQRDETVSDEHTIQIDYMTAVKLLRIRELQYKSLYRGTSQPNPTDEVQVGFGEELAYIASEEQAFQLPEPEIPFVPPEEEERISLEGEIQRKIDEEASLKLEKELQEAEMRHRREEEERRTQAEETRRRREERERRRREDEVRRRQAEEERRRQEEEERRRQEEEERRRQEEEEAERKRGAEEERPKPLGRKIRR